MKEEVHSRMSVLMMIYTSYFLVSKLINMCALCDWLTDIARKCMLTGRLCSVHMPSVKVNSFCGRIQQKGGALSSYVIATFLSEFSLFSGLTLLVWRKEGHPACRKLGVGLLVMMI